MDIMTNQTHNDGEFSVKDGLLIAFLGLVLFAVVFAINSALPVEIRAKRYAYGIISRIDMFGWVLLAMSLFMMAGKKYVQSSIGIVLGSLILTWSYHLAFEFAREESPDTFSKFASLEIGCFPDEWQFILEKHNLDMWDQAVLCSEEL